MGREVPENSSKLGPFAQFGLWKAAKMGRGVEALSLPWEDSPTEFPVAGENFLCEAATIKPILQMRVLRLRKEGLCKVSRNQGWWDQHKSSSLGHRGA